MAKKLKVEKVDKKDETRKSTNPIITAGNAHRFSAEDRAKAGF